MEGRRVAGFLDEIRRHHAAAAHQNEQNGGIVTANKRVHLVFGGPGVEAVTAHSHDQGEDHKRDDEERADARVWAVRYSDCEEQPAQRTLPSYQRVEDQTHLDRSSKAGASDQHAAKPQSQAGVIFVAPICHDSALPYVTVRLQ